MPDRLPLPGPSFVRDRPVRLGDRSATVGMTRPTTTDDGWWLAVLWVADGDGVLSFEDLAPPSGAPPQPPLLLLGPAVAGNLSGMILEENNRLSVRLGPIAPPDDPARPWQAPAAIRAAFKWEPLRVGTMRPNELAGTVADAFARAVEALGRF
jgi:hypothetical protein